MHITARLTTDDHRELLHNSVFYSENGIAITIQVTRRFVDRPTHDASNEETRSEAHRMVILSMGDFFDVQVPFEGPWAEVNTVEEAFTIACTKAQAYLRTLPDRIGPVIEQLGHALKAGAR